MYEQLTFDDVDDWQPNDLRCVGPHMHWCDWVDDDDLPSSNTTWEIECWTINGTIVPATPQCLERWRRSIDYSPREDSLRRAGTWSADEEFIHAFVDALKANKPKPRAPITLGHPFRGEPDGD